MVQDVIKKKNHEVSIYSPSLIFIIFLVQGNRSIYIHQMRQNKIKLDTS